MYSIHLFTFLLIIITLTSGYVIKHSKNNDFMSVTTDLPNTTLSEYMDHSRGDEKLSKVTPNTTNESFTKTSTIYAVSNYISYLFNKYFSHCNCMPQSTTVVGSLTTKTADISSKSMIDLYSTQVNIFVFFF